MNIMISETTEYDELVDLFIRSDLEFSKEEPVSTDIIMGYKAVDGEKLIGGCVLAKREGEFIIDGIAVEQDYGKTGVGSMLLEKALEFARGLGGHDVFLVARAPEFFRKHNFQTIEREKGPLFFECYTCPQFNKTCFPEVMKRSL
jgi:N-acetylglutamate synthase-like GNAT family acetyltransferase